MSGSPNPRIAIVGGGLSGLAAAHRLVERLPESEQRPQIVLFETAPRPGGVFGTEVVDGYRLELGADTFITDKPWGVDLCRRLGLGDQLVVPDPLFRRSLILHRGYPVETPEGFQLMAPARFRPVLASPILSPLGKLRLLCEPFIPVRPGDDDESLAEFVRRRLGQEALERIVQPLVGGIYTGDPAKLSLLATFPRFREMERRHGSLVRGMWASRKAAKDKGAMDDRPPEASGARYGLFVSLREGMGTLQQTLLDRIVPTVTVRTNTTVQGIVVSALHGQQRFQIQTGTGEQERFDAVIVATPSHVAAGLLRDDCPELATLLAEIEYASSAIVVTGHRMLDVEHPLDAYGLVIPETERRRILAVSFLSRKYPAYAPDDRVILRTFVGGAMHPEMMALSDADLLTVVREELRKILGVRGEPEVVRIMRYERSMPQYHVGHLERVRRIDERVADVPGLFLCGNAYRGVGVPDCVHQAEIAADRAWAAVKI